MATTESSVVVALREVRRLELERQRREEEARSRRYQEERARDAARQRPTAQYGHGPYGQAWSSPQEATPDGYGHPMAAPGYDGRRQTAEVVPVAANGYGNPYAGAYGEPQGWDPSAAQAAGYAAPRRSSAGAVFFTALLFSAAGGAGYWKLNQDFSAKLRSAELDRQRIEESRNQALEGRSRAEQEAKVRVAACEERLSGAAKAAAAAAAAAALAPAAPAAAKVEERKPEPSRGRAAARRSVAKAERSAPKVEKAPPPPAEKPAPVRKIANKKSVSDDPLGGLKFTTPDSSGRR
jgi:hypothetical protein